ncbi:hypothetical protein Micbo1qcDRAFT_179906 [Microdochium bolleyi]|uniref:Uncharacterized protein n=1 Tax=Microdochium bolleyi TaxID=196109 RepID=A0A136INX3_9PEZI|nr:hypothetical protein Micbo1qcDRAFT_179906 [Microdochium bolleyi]
MRLSSVVLAAAAAFNSAASATHIFQYINLVPSGVVWAELRTNDGKVHKYGWFLDGCKGNFDFLKQTCIDYGRERAHIVWSSNGKKTCFKLTKKDGGKNCGPQSMYRDFCEKKEAGSAS